MLQVWRTRHRSHSCPKWATLNVVEQVEEGAEVENEDEVGVEGADPYSFTSNEIQENEEGEPLGRSLVIQRLLLTLRRELNDQRQEIFWEQCTIN